LGIAGFQKLCGGLVTRVCCTPGRGGEARGSGITMETKQMVDEPPPFLGSWRNVYIFVLAYEAVVITLFYIFTRVMA
jgi:hypothetical protein